MDIGVKITQKPGTGFYIYIFLTKKQWLRRGRWKLKQTQRHMQPGYWVLQRFPKRYVYWFPYQNYVSFVLYECISVLDWCSLSGLLGMQF